jgi:SpoVK/Ycf46/Vps4 family AAA+-type ATPase
MRTNDQQTLPIRQMIFSRGLIDLGGFGAFKAWVRSRGAAFTEAGQQYGLTAPRGVLLVGVPGTGKSLAAKGLAAEWNMPLFMLDMGAVFSSYLGESEARLRNVFDYAEQHAPCVVWMDEIERGLAAGAENDSGVTARLIGGMLVWLQERKAQVFIAATANQVKKLPPELTRPGRFDLLWGADLPGYDSRQEIFAIHLRAHRRDPKNFNLEELSFQADGMTGAEIASAISDSLYFAFEQRENLTNEHVVNVLSGSRPMSVRYRDEIKELREWMRIHTEAVGG